MYTNFAAFGQHIAYYYYHHKVTKLQRDNLKSILKVVHEVEIEERACCLT